MTLGKDNIVLSDFKVIFRLKISKKIISHWNKLITMLMSIPPFLGKQFTNLFRVARKSSAFTPLIWLLLVVGAIVYKLLPTITDQKVKDYLVYAFIVLLGFICMMYVLFWLFKPDRLHSETYLLENKKLELIREKGQDISINSVDFPISDAYKLEEGGKGD